MVDQVILVDKNDKEIGLEEKLEAHKKGSLHRAFSVAVFNANGQLLLQKRASDKYHSAGLWSNTCCSHPRPGEDVLAAAHRRLQEEMGFDCPLFKTFEFYYKADLDNAMTEHEYDHLFIGFYEGDPKVNPAEAQEWKWMDVAELYTDMQKNPNNYTYWFKLFLAPLMQYLQEMAEAQQGGDGCSGGCSGCR